MKNEDLVEAAEFCSVNNIEISFLYSLEEYGIIDLVKREEMICIPAVELADLEKIIRLYYDLGINFEGLGTVIDLLRKFEEMNQQIAELRNRLSFYENFTTEMH